MQRFVCAVSSMDCWYGECDKCSGDTPHDLQVSWFEWKQNNNVNRTEKREEKGKLSDLISHLATMSSQFLVHCYNKREQADSFNNHDRPRALNEEYAIEGLIQVDFAENFVCVNQDEVQKAHWNQNQLTLFTTAFYYNNNFHGKVFVSDNKVHAKETIVAYLWKLLSSLPSTLRILKLWSDGPVSQFKNKFMAALMSHFEEKFEIKIIWNYFATSHGKGCVDGLGATVKQVVRKHIKARDIVVNNAADFVRAFKMTPSEITVEEMTNNEIEKIYTDLKADELFAKAKPIRNISSAHQMQLVEGKVTTYYTSKQGYN